MLIRAFITPVTHHVHRLFRPQFLHPLSKPAISHAPRSIRACTSSSIDPPPSTNFAILDEQLIFRRYQTIYKREVQYPNGQQVSFDVLGNSKSDFKSVFIFPFNTHFQTVTMIREYAPGPHKEQLSFPAGMFEPAKHVDLETAARAELSEEARLKDGQLVLLTNNPISADKYSKNQYFFYLALDCRQDEQPGERDEEEWMTVVPGLSLSRVRQLIVDGEINTPNSMLGLLALAKLQQMGFH